MIIHVIPRGKKWAVKKKDARKALRLCESVKSAYDFAQSVSSQVRQIVIFRKDNSVARVYSFTELDGLKTTEIEFFSG